MERQSLPTSSSSGIDDRAGAIGSPFSLLQESYDSALRINETSTTRWENYKESLEEVSKNLGEYSKHLKCPILVPIGKKAFMKGNLVHTNECLVCLGDGWFVKQSAAQTQQFCSRRIKHCDEKLKSLKKESDLLESRKKFPTESEVFAQENAQEIVEPYDEEAEAAWRVKHREREKEYRKRLAEERKSANKGDKDVWEKLSKLELEEKLGLAANMQPNVDENEEDDEYLDEEDYSTDTLSDEYEEDPDEDPDEAQEEAPDPPESSTERKRSITFDLEEHNDEDLDDIIVIKFNHSTLKDSSTEVSEKSKAPTLDKPSDIYHHFPHLFKPKSILKKSSSLNESVSLESFSYPAAGFVGLESAVPHQNNSLESALLENLEPTPQVFGDIVERKVAEPAKLSEPTPIPVPVKPISKFKAARKSTS